MWPTISIHISTIVIFCVILYYTLYKKSLRSKYLKALPGPTPLPFVGNLLNFLGGTEVFLNQLHKYITEFGETILIHDGVFSVAVITVNKEFMERIMGSSYLIRKADQYEYFRNWLATGLLTSSGKKWKDRRRVITPSFHFSILTEFVDIFENVGDILIKKLNKRTKENSVDIYPLITLCTLDIICEAAMGTPINAQLNRESEYVKSIKVLCKIIIERTFSLRNAMFYPLSINYFKEKRALNVVHKFVMNVIDKRVEMYKNSKINIENNNKKTRKAFLDLLLECTINGQPLSKQDLMEEVNTFMFEGHDTTSSAITFTLYSIASNPEVQEKILDEQIDIFGTELKSAKAGYNELQRMKYLELVIKEALRLYPSVPFFGRKLEKDVYHDGILYPKDLNLMILPYVAHRNPTVFPEPDKFIPERFETMEGRNPYAYVPFSAGPRNCIGQKFAMLEMKSTISKIVRNFHLMPTNPPHKMVLAAEAILVSKNGVRIQFVER